MLIEDIGPCLVAPTATVKQVIENLTNSGLLIALVVDSDGLLLGLVGDGDIRRGLLSGSTLGDPVTKIMNPHFSSARKELASREIRALAELRGVIHIPLVDHQERVVALYVDNPNWLPRKKTNLVVIMAGGKGNRLRPLTEKTPKPMVRVAGKPMMQHMLENLRAEGFCTFVVSVNYLSQQIEEYFGDGDSFGVDITYLREKQPLGTAGSLSLIKGEPKEPLIVINGDVLITAKVSEMLSFHLETGAEMTIGVKLVENQIPFGVVEIQGSTVTAIQEKPVRRDFVNAGVYVLEPSILKHVKAEQRKDMTELVLERLDAKAVRAFPIHEEWIDMGSPEDLIRASKEFGL